MYTEQDYSAISAQFKKRVLVASIPAVLLLGGIVWSFIVRIKWLTMLLTALTGAYCVFMHGMLIAPIAAYRRHIANALTGRTRKTTGIFKEMETTAVQREGVQYFPMLITVGDPADPEDDRLFYYDANLPRPDWTSGQKLTITSHDKFVADWEK